MVIKKLYFIGLFILLFSLMSSCDYIFGSYFEETNDLLERQIKFLPNLEDKYNVYSMQMQILQGMNWTQLTTKYLAISVNNGYSGQIFMLDPQTLTIQAQIGSQELRGLSGNNNLMPYLGAFATTQNGQYIIGDISYDPNSAAKWSRSNVLNGISSILNGSASNQKIKFFIPNCFFVGDFSSTSTTGTSNGYFKSFSISTSLPTSPLNFTTVLMDAIAASPNYNLIVQKNSINYLITCNQANTASFTQKRLTDTENNNVVNGWATPSAAVLAQKNNNNQATLNAFRWDGTQLSSVSVDSNDQVIACFDPFDGTYWYKYDFDSGNLLKLRTWWSP